MANMYGMVLARHHHFPDIKSKGTGVTCGWQHKMAVFKERCGGGGGRSRWRLISNSKWITNYFLTQLPEYQAQM